MKESNTQLAWPLIGNEKAIEFLTKSLLSRRLAQTYIFTGPSNLGKTTIAYCFAKNLMLLDSNSNLDLAHMDLDKLNLSGDFHAISREVGKKNISIDQIREFIKILEMSSFANSYKIGVIKEAETLSPEAANALLKLLEEPQEKVVIILITSHLEHILPTIASRSQVINFYPVRTEVIHDKLVKEYGATPSLAKKCSRLALGRPALAVKFFEDQEFYQDYLSKVNVFLNFFNNNLVERLADVNQLLSEKKEEASTGRTTSQILEIWEGVVRDLLLLNLEQEDLIQNLEARETLLAVKERASLSRLQKLWPLFKISQEYLAANVGPRNVLENIAINI
jgi:DNA polymerase-3 subunit delta'